MSVKKSKFVLEKKPPRAQTFRYFRYESRNNNKLFPRIAREGNG